MYRVLNCFFFQITRIFCEDLQRFHTLFLSCNEPINGTEWCNKCEKCVFVFLLLSAYLAPDKTESIFGKNLFRQVELLPVFKNLLGITGTKPFECVGTVDEARAALRLAVQQYQQFYGDMNSSEISRECNRASFATIIDGEESTACLPIEDVEGHSSSSAETCNRNEDCVRIPPLLLELRSLFLN